MQDRELYRQILGIEAPWFVERVELKLNQGEVHIYLEHGEMASWPCPECETSCQLYDHQGERQWRHLDTCQYQTILHARPPRTECAEHGGAGCEVAVGGTLEPIHSADGTAGD